MKKFTLIFILPLLCSSLTYSQKDDEKESGFTQSQQIKFIKSAPYEVIDGGETFFKIGSNVLAIKSNVLNKDKFEHEFLMFSGENLDLKSRMTAVPMDLIKEQGASISGYYQMQNKIYLLYTISDESQKKDIFFAREVNVQDGGFVDKSKVLFSVPWRERRDAYRSGFSLAFSDDKSKLLVTYNHVELVQNAYVDLATKDKTTEYLFESILLNLDMEEIWQQKVSIPYNPKSFEILKIAVSSTNQCYILIEKAKTFENRKTYDYSERLELIQVGADNALKHIPLSIPNYQIFGSVLIVENKMNEIVVAGTYQKEKALTYDGMFMFSINDEGDISKPRLYRFSPEIISKYRKLSDKEIAKIKDGTDEGKLGLDFISASRLKFFIDGSMLMIAQKAYTVAGSYGGSSTINECIILCKIDKDGSVAWTKKIPKFSEEGFATYYSENNAYVVFNDNLLNEKLETNEKPPREKNTNVAYKIDLENGEHQYHPLFTYTTVDGIPATQASIFDFIQIAPSKFAFEAYIKNKQDMMFQIEFE